jgi:phage terminase large subunit
MIILTDKIKTINSVVAMTLPHLKKGAIRDFVTIMQSNGLYEDARWNRTDFSYTFPNGSILEFFSADSEKVHGAQRDRLFGNEVQFMNWETIRQLLVRTSGTSFFDYNPIRSLWIDEQILNNPEQHNNHVLFNSTYKDNPYLSPEQVRMIESQRNDEVWWQVYGDGQIGTIRPGCIYSGWEMIDDDTFDAIDYSPVYGLDFGFSPDPTALVEIKFDKRNLYIRELIYEIELSDDAICARMLKHGVTKDAYIIADYGGGGNQRIFNFRSGVTVGGQVYDYNMFPAYKKPGSIKDGINIVQSYNVFVTKGSSNVWNEYNLYRRRMDADGAFLPDPVDKDNHAMDAIRYVAIMHERGVF